MKTIIDAYDKSTWKDQSIEKINKAIEDQIFKNITNYLNEYYSFINSELYMFYVNISYNIKLIEQFKIKAELPDNKIIKIINSIRLIWTTKNKTRSLETCQAVSNKANKIKKYINSKPSFYISGNEAFDFAFTLYERE